MRKLIVFDLDGTLAASKSTPDSEMSALLRDLLRIVRIAVISGGDWPQFEKQLLAGFSPADDLANLSLLPTCGTKFFRYAGGWQQLYSEDLTANEKQDITRALHDALVQAAFKTERSWGAVIEDRGSQLTFSALGQEAPLDEKSAWDPDLAKRKKIVALLRPMLPGFSVAIGGATSIDITRIGIDKGYGIRKLRDVLGIRIEDMIFIGDALFPGGNDYPAKEAGALSIRVRDPQECKRVIETIIACLSEGEPLAEPRSEVSHVAKPESP